MKKVTPILAIAALAIAFTSCKKDHTCECTSSLNGTTIGTSSTTFKETKKKAKDACSALETTTSVGGQTASTSCSLK